MRLSTSEPQENGRKPSNRIGREPSRSKAGHNTTPPRTRLRTCSPPKVRSAPFSVANPYVRRDIGGPLAWMISYIFTPLILLPLLVPYFFLNAAKWAFLFGGSVATTVADTTIATVELVRRHRAVLSYVLQWMSTAICWTESKCRTALLDLAFELDHLLARVTAKLIPLARQMLHGVPFLEQIVAIAAVMAEDALMAFERIAEWFHAIFIVVHDEIVPVAWEWAEKVPFLAEILEQLLHGPR